jgi:hypothetical protein
MAIPDLYPAEIKAASDASGVPVPFLRAQAFHESGLKADAKPGPEWHSSARGLFQILNFNREAFNKEMGENITEDGMYDPMNNARVAAWLHRKVAKAYSNTGIEPLKSGWFVPDPTAYAGLVALGWTAGHNGVIEVVRKLNEKGFKPERINADTVIDAAGVLFPHSKIYVDPKKADKDGHGPFMSHPELRVHIRGIVRDWKKLSGRPADAVVQPPVVEPPKKPDNSGALGTFIGLAIGGGILFFYLSRPS